MEEASTGRFRICINIMYQRKYRICINHMYQQCVCSICHNGRSEHRKTEHLRAKKHFCRRTSRRLAKFDCGMNMHRYIFIYIIFELICFDYGVTTPLGVWCTLRMSISECVYIYTDTRACARTYAHARVYVYAYLLCTHAHVYLCMFICSMRTQVNYHMKRNMYRITW